MCSSDLVIHNIENNIHQVKAKSTFWYYVNLIRELTQTITTFVMLFGIITYTRYFNLFGAGIVIIVPQRVDAYIPYVFEYLNPFNFIAERITNFFGTISSVIEIIFLIMLIILLILFVKIGFGRTVIITKHYGRH